MICIFFCYCLCKWAGSAAIGLNSCLDIATALANNVSIFASITAKGNPKKPSCGSKQTKAP